MRIGAQPVDERSSCLIGGRPDGSNRGEIRVIGRIELDIERVGGRSDDERELLRLAPRDRRDLRVVQVRDRASVRACRVGGP